MAHRVRDLDGVYDGNVSAAYHHPGGAYGRADVRHVENIHYYDDGTKILQNIENPRQKGKTLTKNLSGLWWYRVEDYRIIGEIQDDEMIVLALRVGNRSKVYKR